MVEHVLWILILYLKKKVTISIICIKVVCNNNKETVGEKNLCKLSWEENKIKKIIVKKIALLELWCLLMHINYV